jgi:uncharacterized protein YtpQ (UPF0354 family)
MRYLLTLIFCGVALCAGICAEMLTPRAFTDEFARAVGAAMASSTVSVTGDLELAIADPDGRQRTLILRNAYKEYSLDPGRLDEIVRAFVAAMSARWSGKTDRSRIVPVIKDRQWLEDQLSGFRARGIEQEHVAERLNNELVIVYVEDDPTRMRYIMTGEDIGIARAELRALAVENLRRILPKIEMRGVGELSMLSAGGDYEPSLLLVDDIWSSGQIKVPGDIVVAVPARDVLLVTGSRSRLGLKGIRELAAKFMAQGPYGLTDTLFVYRNGRFTKFGR